MKNYKLLMEIIGLAILVNENTELCVFVDFSGHVKSIDVRIFPSKSEEHTQGEKLYSASSYYEEESWMEEGSALANLQAIKEVLSGYLFDIKES